MWNGRRPNDDNYIIDDAWTPIYRAKIVIVDYTSGSVNVFYELGMAHLLGKEVVIIAQSKQEIPLDILHRRYRLYNKQNLPGLKAQLKRELEHVLN